MSVIATSEAPSASLASVLSTRHVPPRSHSICALSRLGLATGVLTQVLVTRRWAP